MKNEYSSLLLFAEFNPSEHCCLLCVPLLYISWNSALFPSSIFTCSVQFSKWKADIRLNNKEMVFVMENQSVYYERRTEFLCLLKRPSCCRNSCLWNTRTQIWKWGISYWFILNTHTHTRARTLSLSLSLSPHLPPSLSLSLSLSV
jgi:hypothetical protein